MPLLEGVDYSDRVSRELRKMHEAVPMPRASNGATSTATAATAATADDSSSSSENDAALASAAVAKSADGRKVWRVRFTGEEFGTYDAFLECMSAYRKRQWTCAYTGRSAMSFEEALMCESDAKRRMRQFPASHRAHVARSAQHSLTPVNTLCRDLFTEFAATFVPGEIVQWKITEDRARELQIKAMKGARTGNGNRGSGSGGVGAKKGAKGMRAAAAHSAAKNTSSTLAIPPPLTVIVKKQLTKAATTKELAAAVDAAVAKAAAREESNAAASAANGGAKTTPTKSGGGGGGGGGPQSPAAAGKSSSDTKAKKKSVPLNSSERLSAAAAANADVEFVVEIAAEQRAKSAQALLRKIADDAAATGFGGKRNDAADVGDNMWLPGVTHTVKASELERRSPPVSQAQLKLFLQVNFSRPDKGGPLIACDELVRDFNLSTEVPADVRAALEAKRARKNAALKRAALAASGGGRSGGRAKTAPVPRPKYPKLDDELTAAERADEGERPVPAVAFGDSDSVLQIPREAVSDTLLVWEFATRFSKHILLSSFSFAALLAALRSREKSPLLEEVHTRLVNFVMDDAVSKWRTRTANQREADAENGFEGPQFKKYRPTKVPWRVSIEAFFAMCRERDGVDGGVDDDVWDIVRQMNKRGYFRLRLEERTRILVALIHYALQAETVRDTIMDCFESADEARRQAREVRRILKKEAKDQVELHAKLAQEAEPAKEASGGGGDGGDASPGDAENKKENLMLSSTRSRAPTSDVCGTCEKLGHKTSVCVQVGGARRAQLRDEAMKAERREQKALSGARIAPIGVDRDWRRYFVFRAVQGRLFVEDADVAAWLAERREAIANFAQVRRARELERRREREERARIALEEAEKEKAATGDDDDDDDDDDSDDEGASTLKKTNKAASTSTTTTTTSSAAAVKDEASGEQERSASTPVKAEKMDVDNDEAQSHDGSLATTEATTSRAASATQNTSAAKEARGSDRKDGAAAIGRASLVTETQITPLCYYETTEELDALHKYLNRKGTREEALINSLKVVEHAVRKVMDKKARAREEVAAKRAAAAERRAAAEAAAAAAAAARQEALEKARQLSDYITEPIAMRKSTRAAAVSSGFSREVDIVDDDDGDAQSEKEERGHLRYVNVLAPRIEIHNDALDSEEEKEEARRAAERGEVVPRDGSRQTRRQAANAERVRSRSKGRNTDDESDEPCVYCRLSGDDDKSILCDGCDRAFHMYCLFPPLERVPRGSWYCDDCKRRQDAKQRETRRLKRAATVLVDSSDDDSDLGGSGRGGKRARRSSSARSFDVDDGSSSNNSDSEDAQSGEDEQCDVCNRDTQPAKLLLCENDCGIARHTFCCEPPLDKVPSGDWYCPNCQVETVKCSVCDSDVDPKLLILCENENCDGAMHTYCHKPKLDKVPAGEWYCPRCAADDDDEMLDDDDMSDDVSN